jgi:DNA helicase-2/ATP-dependent DNA helicase PcrA
VPKGGFLVAGMRVSSPFPPHTRNPAHPNVSTLSVPRDTLACMARQFILKGSPKDRGLKIDYSKDLNQEQLDAVLNGDGACLVLAGAGSGKTRTITYRVAYLIERGVRPSEILLLTFTNKSAREMLERVERLLGASVQGIWGGTFHSVANRLLRMHPEEAAYEKNFTILDSEDSKSMFKTALKEMKIDPKARRFPAPAVCANIISYTRNVCGTIGETLELKHPNFLELEPEIAELAKRYEDRKRQSNAMDFDDLLANLLAMLDDPDAGPRISSRFRYVLVDEYQDTNAIQARIVSCLARRHGNAFVVGDDAQSIYAFRGADVRNILHFPREHPDTRIFKLLTNYRSTPQILHLANESLRHNVDQFEKDLVGLCGGGDRPSLVPCVSARQEAQYVAERILELRDQGTALGNMAVLFRATGHSQRLELELLKRDVPYEYRGGVRLFERAHIKDVLAYLRVFENGKDEQAWMRILLMQAGIGPATALRAARSAAERGTPGALIRGEDVLPTKARTGWEELQKIMQGVLNEAPNPSRMIRAAARSGYQDYLEREYPNWRDRLEDVEQFALFAEAYDDLGAFLADVSLYDDVFTIREKGKPRGDERLILSTVHQAKGLEWDTVFVIHLSDGAFPNRRALEEDGGVEEERRLFYVACTRAKKRLHLSYPVTMGADMLVLNRPSMFLDELDPRLMERVEVVYMPGAFRENDWSWDADGEDGIIELDEYGEQKKYSKKISKESNFGSTRTVWKSRQG